MDLPVPEEVTKSLNKVSELVARLNEIAVRLGKTYGVHGPSAARGGYSFAITRLNEKWGIYADKGDGKPKLITGCRIEGKRAFLHHDLKAFFNDYVKQVCEAMKEVGKELVSAEQTTREIENELKSVIGDLGKK